MGEVRVVGIGASAGGLEALVALVRRLTRDELAFVVVQHLAPHHPSALTQLLARDSALPVVTIQDGMTLAPATIHVTPPDVAVALEGDVLRLRPLTSRSDGARHAIDDFFRSLAAAKCALAIGVILSGAGSDGTRGLEAIKEQGGWTFVQDPLTAQQPNMPRSAIDAGNADFCLAPGEIADELMRVAHEPPVPRPRSLARPFGSDAMTRLLQMLGKAFGVDFRGYKQSTIARRVARRMDLHQLTELEDYVQLVATTPTEVSALQADLLIGVTHFFRDEKPFEALRGAVFSRILEGRDPNRAIRVWVAACATGEEAYSIAMCLLEHLQDAGADLPVQIFASDVSAQALSRARKGTYPANIEADVSPERLRRFFIRTDTGYCVKRELRDRVLFARHDILKDPPFSHLDLVTCRNLLVYLEPAVQTKVFGIFHHALEPGGFLLLGTSETVGSASNLFELVDRSNRIYRRRAEARLTVPDLGRLPRSERGFEHPALTVMQLADRKVIELYGPPGVVVNEALEVLQFRGKTDAFFAPAAGAATLALLKLLRAELLGPVREAAAQALATAEPAAVTVAALEPESHFDIRVDVMPLFAAGIGGKRLLISFVRQPATPALEPAVGDAGARRVRELERQLRATTEALQLAVDHLQTTNEELLTSNEELQTNNEELQSSNEELQSSQEELRSGNEELVTLNQELQLRLDQLSRTSDDLRNVLTQTSAAIVLVDMSLRIGRFSTAAAKLLGLSPEDVGRPVAYLKTFLDVRDLERLIARAVDTGTPFEQRVRCLRGPWLSMRLAPHQAADEGARGAVIDFVAIKEESDGNRAA